MELLLLTPTSLLCQISSVNSIFPCSNLTFNGGFTRHRNFYRKPYYISFPIRISKMFEFEQEPTSNDYLFQDVVDDTEVLWGSNSNCVEVIGIGSRKDAILDFCLDSPFQSSLSTALRFWHVLPEDSIKMQLHQKSRGKDMGSRNIELPAPQLSTPRAVILVATAGYGLDHIAAIELLQTVKAANGLAVGIILKPFSFEGQRRQDEVKHIANKVLEHTDFCIVVDTDVLLLKKEVVTLAEALKSANNAVLLAINCIFILMSERNSILFDYTNNRKELKVTEVIKLLESFKEATIGFGAGSNLKSSIARAVFECPFIGGGIKDLNGMVVCTISSAAVMDSSDRNSSLRTFRQITGWKKEVVFSIVHEPNLERSLFVTTVMVLGISKETVPQRKGFLSGLALRLPFVFSLLGRDHPEPKDPLSAHLLDTPHHPEDILLDGRDIANLISVGGNNGSAGLNSEELQTLFDSSHDDSNAISSGGCETEGRRTEVEITKANNDFGAEVHDQTSKGHWAFDRESLISWNAGPYFHIRQERVKQRASKSGSSPLADNPSLYTVPIGVKPSEQISDGSQFTNTHLLRERTSDDMNGEPLGTLNSPSLDVVVDAGLEAGVDIYNTASTINGKNVDSSRKQGMLSVRAASMLDAERESQKKWSPIMEMQYQGGIYKGRCQGGLPEGKGRLTLVNGCIYDGMWHYGKKSGIGTFYYINGDVFQGSWRDDLMHGKGWFYFHSGDRWFANYWKGKANGEGRFYSKDGEIFLGHFQDGWRNGHSLCISADGTRWAEIWDEGVLLSREPLDS